MKDHSNKENPLNFLDEDHGDDMLNTVFSKLRLVVLRDCADSWVAVTDLARELEPDVLSRKSSPRESILDFMREHFYKGDKSVASTQQAEAWQTVYDHCHKLSGGEFSRTGTTGISDVINFIDELHTQATSNAQTKSIPPAMTQVKEWRTKAEHFEALTLAVAEVYPDIAQAEDKMLFVAELLRRREFGEKPVAFIPMLSGGLIPLHAPSEFNVGIREESFED